MVGRGRCVSDGQTQAHTLGQSSLLSLLSPPRLVAYPEATYVLEIRIGYGFWRLSAAAAPSELPVRVLVAQLTRGPRRRSHEAFPLCRFSHLSGEALVTRRAAGIVVGGYGDPPPVSSRQPA